MKLNPTWKQPVLRSNSSAVATPVFANLDDVRDQFIQELDNLKPGESPEPYVQNFLPAVLPALRLAIRLGGRKNVVNFLAQLLAKLISKLIGPEQAPALSKAIVDAGLKLLTLEMSDQEKSGLAASAVAGTVEETINRVTSLLDYILDNQVAGRIRAGGVSVGGGRELTRRAFRGNLSTAAELLVGRRQRCMAVHALAWAQAIQTVYPSFQSKNHAAHG